MKQMLKDRFSGRGKKGEAVLINGEWHRAMTGYEREFKNCRRESVCGGEGGRHITIDAK